MTDDASATGIPLAADVRRARTGFIWVGVVAPFALLALAAAVVLAWMPELPDPIATHWGTGGVDGFLPRAAFLPALLGICGGVLLLDAVLAVVSPRMPQSSTKPPVRAWSATSKLLGAMNLGLGAGFALLLVSSAGIQRGLADATDAPGIGGWAALAMLAMVVFAVVGWFVQPKSPDYGPVVAAQAESLPLAGTERAAWFGTASMARTGVVVLLVALGLLVLMTVFWIARGADGWQVLVATTLLIAVLTATMLVFRVRIDRRGVLVRSLIGWPRTRIPLDDIDDVATATIDPLREFGGWGWRIAVDGRRGVVLRAGEALQATRANGRVFVVTVDGAAEAAAVLETLRLRSKDDRS